MNMSLCAGNLWADAIYRRIFCVIVATLLLPFLRNFVVFPVSFFDSGHFTRHCVSAFPLTTIQQQCKQKIYV